MCSRSVRPLRNLGGVCFSPNEVGGNPGVQESGRHTARKEYFWADSAVLICWVSSRQDFLGTVKVVCK